MCVCIPSKCLTSINCDSVISSKRSRCWTGWINTKKQNLISTFDQQVNMSNNNKIIRTPEFGVKIPKGEDKCCLHILIIACSYVQCNITTLKHFWSLHLHHQKFLVFLVFMFNCTWIRLHLMLAKRRIAHCLFTLMCNAYNKCYHRMNTAP
jgi:hypothetical protein